MYCQSHFRLKKIKILAFETYYIYICINTYALSIYFRKMIFRTLNQSLRGQKLMH